MSLLGPSSCPAFNAQVYSSTLNAGRARSRAWTWGAAVLGLGMSNRPMLQPEEGPDPELRVPCPPWLQPHSRLPAPAGWQRAQHLLLPPRGVPAAAAVQRALPHPGACRQCSPDVAAALCVFPGPAATGGTAGRCPEPGRRFHSQSCLHPLTSFCPYFASSSRAMDTFGSLVGCCLQKGRCLPLNEMPSANPALVGASPHIPHFPRNKAGLTIQPMTHPKTTWS